MGEHRPGAHPGQYQVTHHNGKTYVRPKFNAFDRVRLRDAFVCLDDGKRYEAGWKGKIFPFATTITECWDSDLYEVSLDGDAAWLPCTLNHLS